MLKLKKVFAKLTLALALVAGVSFAASQVPSAGQPVQAASKKTKRNKVVSLAKKQVGKRYVWGATGPYSFFRSRRTRNKGIGIRQHYPDHLHPGQEGEDGQGFHQEAAKGRPPLLGFQALTLPRGHLRWGRQVRPRRDPQPGRAQAEPEPLLLAINCQADHLNRELSKPPEAIFRWLI